VSTLYLPKGHPDSVECIFPNRLFDRYSWASSRHHAKWGDGPRFSPLKYTTDYFAEEASRAIHTNRDNPFFLYLALNAVHSPLQALRSDYDALNSLSTDHCSKVYGAMIIALDRAVGVVLDTLRKNETLFNNTIIIFSSDNGGANYISQPSSNAPYRGWKATFFEGGIKVPYFIQWPAVIPALSVTNEVVGHVDLFRTISCILGIQDVKSHPLVGDIDGINLLDVIIPGWKSQGKVEKKIESNRSQETNDRYSVRSFVNR
jgi:arylsulfatase A-like enzyme